MDLRHVQDLLVDETRQKLASLAVELPVARKARTLRDLSRLFQAVGICRLLVDAHIPKFRENLIRSAQARRYYLRRSRTEGSMQDRFLGLSRSEAIFDAFVAGDSTGVREIVALSVEQWHEGWEYEDDFCYYLFVHKLMTTTGFADSAEAGDVLRRFESVLEGRPSTRFELCRSFRMRDTAAFRLAFEAFLDERRTNIDAKRPLMTEYSAQAIFWPASFVSLEGLTWLNLAASSGLALSDSFEFCPDEARGLAGLVPSVEDFFVSLDQALYGS